MFRRKQRRSGWQWSSLRGTFAHSLCYALICASISTLLACSSAFARPQQAAPVFQGSWTATVGAGQVIRGMWSAQARTANSASGSWTLLNEAGEVRLQGTWSATKVRGAWQGSWSARPASGGSYSGSWAADLGEAAGKTLQDMLQKTAEKQVAGSWRSGPYQGNWWLDGSATKAHR